MRIHIKQQVKQKINSNWLANQTVFSQDKKNASSLSRNQKNSNFSRQKSIINEKQSAKDVIKKLIVENSELRKQIFRHEYTISALKVQMLNREVESKNIMREYRQMIQGLLQNMNSQGVIFNSSNWQQRRSKLYEQNDSQKSFACSIQNGFDQSNGSILSQSRRNKSSFSQQKLQKKSLLLYQIQNPEHYQVPKLYFQNNSFDKSESYKNYQFQENQDGDINKYQIIDYQNQYKQTQLNDLNLHLDSISSVTDAYKPNIYKYNGNKMSQIFQTVKLGNVPTAFNSNAETQRISKNTEKKKSTGRMSSEGAASQSSSFKKIIEKGMKNRERINRLLLNNFTKNNEMFY